MEDGGRLLAIELASGHAFTLATALDRVVGILSPGDSGNQQSSRYTSKEIGTPCASTRPLA